MTRSCNHVPYKNITSGGEKKLQRRELFFRNQSIPTVNLTNSFFQKRVDGLKKDFGHSAHGNNASSGGFNPGKRVVHQNGSQNIQRLCSECNDNEKKIQDKAESGTAEASTAVAHKLDSASGRGRGLPEQTLSEMNSSFGADFNGVHIHDDSKSANLNEELHAQAFTHGSDIYFNAGKYNPQSTAGKHLLAHELTHVVQQNQGVKAVQRLPGDKHDLTATSLSGDPILEKTFDKEAVIGKFSHAKGEHVKRIQEALIGLGIELPTAGADSKFGSETETAVKNFQQVVGMSKPEQDGVVGGKTLGLLDMASRNGKVSTDTDKAEDDLKLKDPKKQANDEACKGKPLEKNCSDPTSPPTDATIDAAAQQATDMIDKVLNEQLPPVKEKKADYPNIFNRIFRNNDSRDVSAKVDEVRKSYIEIKNFIGKLKKERDITRCASECDGGCRNGSPAYHSLTKEGKHILNFCPDFEKDKEKILIVLHECHHAAIPGSSDQAYAETRLFDRLDHAKALLNAASFHVYAAWVDTPGSQPIGPAIKDTNLIDDKTQKENVNKVLAFMQQWFRLVPFDASKTVQGAQEAKEKGKYKQNSPRIFMEVVFSKWFGLTAPPTAPTAKDIATLKAIDERVTSMDRAFKVPFVILETNDRSFWTEGPGSEIVLNAHTLSLDQQQMAIALLQELVHATPTISADTEALYVGAINDMRNLRKLDP